MQHTKWRRSVGIVLLLIIDIISVGIGVGVGVGVRVLMIMNGPQKQFTLLPQHLQITVAHYILATLYLLNLLLSSISSSSSIPIRIPHCIQRRDTINIAHPHGIRIRMNQQSQSIIVLCGRFCRVVQCSVALLIPCSQCSSMYRSIIRTGSSIQQTLQYLHTSTSMGNSSSSTTNTRRRRRHCALRGDHERCEAFIILYRTCFGIYLQQTLTSKSSFIIIFIFILFTLLLISMMWHVHTWLWLDAQEMKRRPSIIAQTPNTIRIGFHQNLERIHTNIIDAGHMQRQPGPFISAHDCTWIGGNNGLQYLRCGPSATCPMQYRHLSRIIKIIIR
mmetsp:Transcript_15405/g.22756  ORF Transcript_15405/g.22756 Transcript_15405/m.22756 type:complete len:332 (+) Transcript_15405:811-1806(+)